LMKDADARAFGAFVFKQDAVAAVGFVVSVHCFLSLKGLEWRKVGRMGFVKPVGV
jgi:hypothetical protein